MGGEPSTFYLVFLKKHIFFEMLYIIDMQRLPYTLGQLVSVGSNSAQFKVDTSVYPFPLSDPQNSYLLVCIMPHQIHTVLTSSL